MVHFLTELTIPTIRYISWVQFWTRSSKVKLFARNINSIQDMTFWRINQKVDVQLCTSIYHCFRFSEKIESETWQRLGKTSSDGTIINRQNKKLSKNFDLLTSTKRKYISLPRNFGLIILEQRTLVEVKCRYKWQ